MNFRDSSQSYKRVGGEMGGIGWQLGDRVETYCSGNFLESMRVFLVRSPGKEGDGV